MTYVLLSNIHLNFFNRVVKLSIYNLLHFVILNIKIVFQKTRVSEKEEMFLRALRKSPSDPQAYINYGKLHSLLRDWVVLENWNHTDSVIPLFIQTSSYAVTNTLRVQKPTE